MSDPVYLNRPKSQEEPFLIERTSGYFEYQLPISAKGILLKADSVLLVGNPRGEWELPGGKLELGESPEETVRREVAEEVGIELQVHHPVHGWVYEITPARHVFVLAFGVTPRDGHVRELKVAAEEVGHAEFLQLSALEGLNMPRDYSVAIRRWAALLKES